VLGDLEKVRSAFRIFRLSYTMPKLLLLPVYEDSYRFPVLREVARCRSYFHCVGRPHECKLSILNLSPITCRFGLITIFGRRRPCLISVNYVGLLTFSFMPGDKVWKTQYQLLEAVISTEIRKKTVHSNETLRSTHASNSISDRQEKPPCNA
jgi:hypothetical protein